MKLSHVYGTDGNCFVTYFPKRRILENILQGAIMKSLLFRFAFVFALLFSGAYAQNWRALTSGTTVDLNSVYFTSGSTGYICGSNVFRKTTNGGTNWTAVTTLTGNLFAAMHFANAGTGWVVGDVLSKTTDGGATWTAQKTTAMINVSFRSVFAASATTAYAVGGTTSFTGAIYKTTDGGTNWVAQTSGTTQTLNGVYCTDANTCFAAGNARTLLKTTNGGTNWAAKTIPAGNYNAVQFTSATTGYAAGADGSGALVSKTTDGGETWASQTTSTPVVGFAAIHFPDANTGYGVGTVYAGSNTIRKTINAGVAWTAQTVDTAGVGLVVLLSVYCTGASTCYAVGYGGKILMTGTAVPILTPNRLSNKQSMTTKVFDMQGRKTQLALRKLSRGVYAMEFQSGNSGSIIPFDNR